MTAAEDEDAPRSPLYMRPAVLAALLVIAVIVAFGPAIDGELVWDDAAMVGAAARLPSPWAAFSRDFFGLGAAAEAGAGASWFRPLVTLSYALDLRLFSAAPQFGLHLVNLLWHAAAAVLVAGALARWTRAATAQGKIACWIAALFWAVLPAKAENVAWISGRGDVMGLVLLLAGLAARRALSHPAARAGVAFAGTASALLCKEGFVAAPVIWAIEIAAEHDEGRIRRALRAPEVLASAATVAAYLALRRAYLPIHGGGEAMFAGLSFSDRAALALETLGHAFSAVVACFESHLLRGPIGFAAPGVLLREKPMIAAGGAFVLILGALALRVPRLRPAAALLAGTLLPVANVIPAGLESRFSDRFLYVPSLGIALGMAALLGGLGAAAFRAVGLGLTTGAVGLAFVAGARSARFRDADTLWEWERAHGDRAVAVLHNAGMSALRRTDYVRARARLAETAARYAELGFDEGYPELVEAADLQNRVRGEQDPVSQAAYRRLIEALLAGKAGKVTFHMDREPTFAVPTATPAARAYASAHAPELRMRLLVLGARAGREEASAAAQAEVDACPRCRRVLRDAARVELALAHPDRARALLDRLGPDDEAERDALPELATYESIKLAEGGDLGRARALFLGEAFGPACRIGEPALATLPPDALPVRRKDIGLACRLAGNLEAWQRIRPALPPDMQAEVDEHANQWRLSPDTRLDLEGRSYAR